MPCHPILEGYTKTREAATNVQSVAAAPASVCVGNGMEARMSLVRASLRGRSDQQAREELINWNHTTGAVMLPISLLRCLAALKQAWQAIQVPGPTSWLTILPTEVLGLICRPLSLRGRISLSITCRTLLCALADSEDAWGTMQFAWWDRIMPFLLPWLAKRRQGLRRLDLSFFSAPEGEVVAQAGPQLVACLDGSPLVELSLSYLELSGEEGGVVLQWLGSCTALTSLALTLCGLRCLPDAFEQLTSLAELRLYGNTDLLTTSWAQLRQLTALTWLEIGNCKLSALPAELAALPAELAALPNLAKLGLSDSPELAAAAEEAWSPLAQCSSLTSLDLAYMPFVRLPAALAALAPHLVDLELEFACLEGLWTSDEATLVPLCSLSRLTRLNLDSALEGLPLPVELSCLVALQDLDLRSNESLGEGLALGHLTALTKLYLSSCNLTDLPAGISNLQSLKELWLWWNPLGFSLDISWQCLHRLTALTLLNLDTCKLHKLPPQLAKLRSLAELDLSSNRGLGGPRDQNAATGDTKWAAIEQLTALTHLKAGDCRLHGVPAVFAALSGLRVLSLAGNPGIGRYGAETLSMLVKMTALQRLTLSSCCLPRELERDAIPLPLHHLDGWVVPQWDQEDSEEDNDDLFYMFSD